MLHRPGGGPANQETQVARSSGAPARPRRGAPSAWRIRTRSSGRPTPMRRSPVVRQAGLTENPIGLRKPDRLSGSHYSIEHCPAIASVQTNSISVIPTGTTFPATANQPPLKGPIARENKPITMPTKAAIPSTSRKRCKWLWPPPGTAGTKSKTLQASPIRKIANSHSLPAASVRLQAMTSSRPQRATINGGAIIQTMRREPRAAQVATLTRLKVVVIASSISDG